jgi:YbbR domain-containing protein
VSLRAALTADLPLKLTSLVLALLLWLLAAGEEPASSLLQVQVAIRPPAGRVMIRPVDPVQALVVGPRRELLKLSASPVRLSRVLPDTLEADEVRLELAPGEVELPRGVAVRVQDLQPRVLTVELDSTVQRTVPVSPVVHLRADSGYVLSEVSVVPGMVRLLGPRDRVRRVDSVRTLPLELFGDELRAERVLELDTAELGPVRVHPARVTARVELEAITERTLTGVPVRLASETGATLRASPETVTVRLRGREARLGAILPASIVVVADWSGSATPARVELRVLAPAGITARAEPDSVSLEPRGTDG